MRADAARIHAIAGSGASNWRFAGCAEWANKVVSPQVSARTDTAWRDSAQVGEERNSSIIPEGHSNFCSVALAQGLLSD